MGFQLLGDVRRPFGAVNGEAMFFANNGAVGWELWKTDGTNAGTQLVKDVNLGPASSIPTHTPLHSHNGKVYFAADDGSAGVELWASDGTETGTVLVKDIYPGGNSSLAEYFQYNYTDQVFFKATTLGNEFFFVANEPTTGR